MRPFAMLACLFFFFFLFLFASVEATIQVPTDVLRVDFLSNHTRYGPGVCGVTAICEQTGLYYLNSPIERQTFHCYEGNTTEAQYRIDHGIQPDLNLTVSLFPGFSCNFAESSSRCGTTSRFYDGIQKPVSCVCLDPCFTGPMCTNPVASQPNVVFDDRLFNYRACVEPFLPPSPFYDATYQLYVPPMSATTADYNTWDVAEKRCRQFWYQGTALATSRNVLPIQPAPKSNCPVPCGHFKGGGCAAKELCYRRSAQEMAAYRASGGVPVIQTSGSVVKVEMDVYPMDVCCERGWDGFDCNIPIGCLKTGCDHNGTCLSTGRSDKGDLFNLDGNDIRCINCDPGWTGKYCNVSAPLWTSVSAPVAAVSGGSSSRRLLQIGFQDACDIVRINTAFKTVQAGAIYPEPGRACDCGVQWSEQAFVQASVPPVLFRILDIGNYNNDFSQLRNRLLSPVRYPTVSGLFTSTFTPVNNRIVSSKEEARYLCYQDFFCDGFYSFGSRVAFFSLLANQSASVLPFSPTRLHLIERLHAPTAYVRTTCSNATLDAEYYCSTYPLQCQSIRATMGVGNMYVNGTTNMTTAQVAELHFRTFGHQVRNSPNAHCVLAGDWLEDVSTCTLPLRCIPGSLARNGTGDQQTCGNLTYIQSINPLLRALERIDTFPQPFTATIGTANVISEHGQNNTCNCLPPFRPSNLQTYNDCAIDMCGTGLNQGRVNSSHIGMGGGILACTCLGMWYTDNSTCVGEVCDWCARPRCFNFGTISQNDTCVCTPAFTGVFCDQPVCQNAATTNIVGLLASTTPQIDCSSFCIPPFEGPFCNLTSCIHGVRAYSGGYECICPENYLIGDDGRCAELLCVEGQGTYAGNGTCNCKFPWTGDRCNIDQCTRSPLYGVVGGKAVQSLDASWTCQCNWPFAVLVDPTNTTRNIDIGFCMSHLCGDWGYPTANWTRPVDACNCKLNGYGLSFADYGMGIYTNPNKCTGASFNECPKPCVQADCGLAEAVANANKTFDAYALEAEVTSIGREPFCVCPLSYNYTANTDVNRKCRPYLPCTVNGNQTISIQTSPGVFECLCTGTIDTIHYTSSAGTGRCDIKHDPVLPPTIVSGNISDPILNPVVSRSVATDTPSDDIFGQPRALMIALFSLGGVALLSAGVTSLAGAGGAVVSGTKTAAAAPSIVINNVLPPTVAATGTSGRLHMWHRATGGGGRNKKKGKKGYAQVVAVSVVMLVVLLSVVMMPVVADKGIVTIEVRSKVSMTELGSVANFNAYYTPSTATGQIMFTDNGVNMWRVDMNTTVKDDHDGIVYGVSAMPDYTQLTVGEHAIAALYWPFEGSGYWTASSVPIRHTVYAPGGVFGTPGPSLSSSLQDIRKTEWSKVAYKTLSAPIDGLDDQLALFSSSNHGSTLASINGVVATPNVKIAYNAPAITVDLSGWHIDQFRCTDSSAGGPVFATVVGRAYPQATLIKTKTCKLTSGFITPPRIRVGDQLLDEADVSITRMQVQFNPSVAGCWWRYDETFFQGDPNSCGSAPNGYPYLDPIVGLSNIQFALLAVNLCGDLNNCGHGSCFSTGGVVFNDKKFYQGAIVPLGSDITIQADNAYQASLLPKSAMSVLVYTNDVVVNVFGSTRHPVFGCKCDDGWSGLKCDKPCIGDASNPPFIPCSGRGTCQSSYETVYRAGALKTCQCQCKCSNGYAGPECEFAVQTQNFPAVTQYSVCCFQSFGDDLTTDCAPRRNPMNNPDGQCTPLFASSISRQSVGTQCFNLGRIADTNRPEFSEFLRPVDVCGESTVAAVDRGRCWQNPQVGYTAGTDCWCNHPGATRADGVVLPPLRGYYTSTFGGCKTRTCTSKTFLWPPDATSVTIRNVLDQTDITQRCSGHAQVGLYVANLESNDDQMCDDAFRTTLITNTGPITYFPNATQIYDDTTKALWRYNTPGDCVACSPGWGMLPIDHRLLKGTDYESKWVVYTATGQPNWNGICSERTYHDQQGNVCGGYGIPIYGPTYPFRLLGPVVRYRYIRSVTGCICPMGTIRLESGICQRTVEPKDAEDHTTLTSTTRIGCNLRGQQVAFNGMNSACSCFVNTLYSFNGPNCEAYDAKTKAYGNDDRACLRGQYTYFPGGDRLPVTTNSTNPSAPASGPISGNDGAFNEQVISQLGRNFANPYASREGNLSISVTRTANNFDSTMTDQLVLDTVLACFSGSCQPTANVLFGMASEDGYELWGTFNEVGYVKRNFVGGIDEFNNNWVKYGSWSPFGHYVAIGRNAGFLLSITVANKMANTNVVIPGANVKDRRDIKRIGVLNIALTKQLNPTVFNSDDTTFEGVRYKLRILCSSDVCHPTLKIGITTDSGTTAYGEFDSQGYQDLYRISSTDPAYAFFTPWNHYLTFNPSATRKFPVFIDTMPDPVSGYAQGRFNASETLRINTDLFFSWAFSRNKNTNLQASDVIPILTALTPDSGVPPPVMVAVTQTNGTTAYGLVDNDSLQPLNSFPDIYKVGHASWWSFFLFPNSQCAINPIVVLPVILPQELRMQGDELFTQNYNQFGCSCTDQSLEQGYTNQDSKCVIGCASRTLSPSGGGVCSGKGACTQLPNSDDYGCLCNQVPGFGGAACNVTILRDANGQICGGADRGNISMPTVVGGRQTCRCNKELGYDVRFKDPSCTEGNRTAPCSYTGLCVSGYPDCSQPGANKCTVPNVQGACVQNQTQGDYYCFCRPGAFTGKACDQATTPALRTASGILLSCSGRGTPDPMGTGFCLCNSPYVGYACEIDTTNRPCTFADGTKGQSYVDGESNGIELVF
jgi:hypothetical protein